MSMKSPADRRVHQSASRASAASSSRGHRIMDMQSGHQRLGVRYRHAGTQFQAPRRLIERGDHPLIAVLHRGNQRHLRL